ncbi:MAG: dephospho-CoA kinase [Ruminococcus sp.]|nr:dephospho-CoA kinase [Candidatus Apopatosoma intestinale]
MLIGITGGSGSGKSVACAALARAGYPVIDCDALVHELYDDPDFVGAVGAAFPETVTGDGRIDRKILAGIVFSDRSALARLNDTVFPRILREIQNRAAAFGGDVILDAPTLFESGLDAACDVIIGIVADEKTRLSRICQRDGISEEAGRARLASQKSEDFFRLHCHVIVENNGNPEKLVSEMKNVMSRIGNGRKA